jgi:hypothetical protein
MNTNELKKENLEIYIEELARTINAIKNPKEMEAIIRQAGNCWFKYYNKNDTIRCDIFNLFYKEFRIKAQKLGVDVSKYPEDLSIVKSLYGSN